MEHKLIKTENYLLVVSDENYKSNVFPYLVAERLTTNEFQLWQVDNENDWDDKNQWQILAHLPLKGSPILQGVDLLPPLEAEDVQKLAEKNCYDRHETYNSEYTHAYITGYNKAKEKWKYTEEEMFNEIVNAFNKGLEVKTNIPNGLLTIKDSFHYADGVIQSLSQRKLPVAFKRKESNFVISGGFITGDENQPPGLQTHITYDTTTNSQGQTVWVGEYIY